MLTQYTTRPTSTLGSILTGHGVYFVSICRNLTVDSLTLLEVSLREAACRQNVTNIILLYEHCGLSSTDAAFLA